MTRLRRGLALVPLLALLLLPGPAGAATERPVVLMIHGGAWLFGQPADLGQAGRIARRYGMQPVFVDYPLFNVETANEAVRRAAARWRARGRVVLAYGESVGGTMAELLAAQCRVEVAVGNSAPADLIGWPEGEDAILWAYLGADPETRRRYSPMDSPQCRPVLAMHSPTDAVVDFRFARAYARKFPSRVTLMTVPGGHVGPPRGRNISLGIRWLAKEDGVAHYGGPAEATVASPAARR
jgi:acetyl esterase/lipase